MTMAFNFIGLRFLLYFVSITPFFLTAAKEHVPVYMWGSSSDSKSDEPISALTQMKCDEFKDIIAKKLEHKTVVVFVEENLSVEDFSWQDAMGQGSYPKLGNLARTSEVTSYFPNVHTPVEALSSWTDKWMHASLYPEGLEPDVTLTNAPLLYVNLLDASGSEDRPRLLRKHDSFMSDFYEQLVRKHDSVIAIYTAQHSSWQPEDDMLPPKIRSKRDAGDEVVPEFYNGDNKTFLYSLEPLQLQLGTKNFTLENHSSATTVEYEDDKKFTQLVVTFPTAETTQVTFNFRETSTNYWSMNEIQVVHGTDENYTMTAKGIEAPYHFSYHCGQKVVFQEPPQSSNLPVVNYLTLASIQVQPNLVPSEESMPRFDDAYDCVYFFTAPILSGFFVAIIFAWIMGFGICMIMDIKTMDRFDDPKGKTISINAAE